MAATIRLARHGTKKRPFYRIVAASKEKPRDGRFLEQLGHYDPTREPADITIHMDKLEAWIRKGARPSPTVLRLMKRAGWKGLQNTPEPTAPASAEG
jgi:small subunit ribosomal protein S16